MEDAERTKVNSMGALVRRFWMGFGAMVLVT